jgi:hypothetical protein
VGKIFSLSLSGLALEVTQLPMQQVPEILDTWSLWAVLAFVGDDGSGFTTTEGTRITQYSN